MWRKDDFLGGILHRWLDSKRGRDLGYSWTGVMEDKTVWLGEKHHELHGCRNLHIRHAVMVRYC